MDKEYYVYEWYFIDTQEVFHVGKGKNKRAWERKYKRNKYFTSIVEKYKDKVDVRIYKKELTDDEACDCERERIKYYKSIGQAKTNFHEGGRGGYTGMYDSKERSKKLSEAMKQRNIVGNRNPMFGKTHSEEARKKISETHKGKTLSIEHRRKISEHLRKRVLTEEQRERIRKRTTGVVFTEERRRNISKGLTKHNFKIILEDEENSIDGFVNLIKFMKDKYNLSRTITEQILNGNWKPKFNKHKQYENIKIIKTEIKCID